MQSFDEKDRLIATNQGKLDDLAAKMVEMPESAYHVVGNLPARNAIVGIHGLQYRVLSVSKDGHLHLELLRPNAQAKNSG